MVRKKKTKKKAADSSAADSSAADSSATLYLFCYVPKSGYVLYELDINTKKPTDPYLSPILEIPMGEKPVIGMRCVQLGSKLYFLGGSVRYGDHMIAPEDVYVFDILTNDLKKMDPPLNAGKHDPSVVFTLNGILYALGSIPAVPPEELPFMELFECYDPATGKWELLDCLPPVEMAKKGFSSCLVPQRIDWIKSTVLEERQQVVLYGLEYVSNASEGHHVKFVYDLQKDKWTREVFQERGEFCWEYAGDSFYGLCEGGPPLKSKSGFTSWFDRIDLFRGKPVADVAFISTGGKHVLENGRWADWVFTTFPQHVHGSFRLLRHLGSGHFCYIVSGMVGGSYTLYGDTFPRDLTTLGINIVLFKEVEGAAGRELCFEAEILGSKEYFISTANPRNVDVYSMVLMDDLLAAPVPVYGSTSI